MVVVFAVLEEERGEVAVEENAQEVPERSAQCKLDGSRIVVGCTEKEEINRERM